MKLNEVITYIVDVSDLPRRHKTVKIEYDKETYTLWDCSYGKSFYTLGECLDYLDKNYEEKATITEIRIVNTKSQEINFEIIRTNNV